MKKILTVTTMSVLLAAELFAVNAASDAVAVDIPVLDLRPVIPDINFDTIYTSDETHSVELPFTFASGTPAKAGEVNANFSNIETRTNANIAVLEARIAALTEAVETLQSRLQALEANSVLALDDKLALVDDPYNGGKIARFSGINVQIVDGSGQTYESGENTGNLIIGYNNAGISEGHVDSVCSVSYNPYVPSSCADNGGTWSDTAQFGSHNLIMGKGNIFNADASIITGRENAVMGTDSFTGGQINSNESSFSFTFSSQSINKSGIIIGGQNASTERSGIVIGGYNNDALGEVSVVIGGEENRAEGRSTAILGGSSNRSNGLGNTICGGASNFASSSYSSISGGTHNTTSGYGSCVSGGRFREATGEYDWVAGSLFEDQ